MVTFLGLNDWGLGAVLLTFMIGALIGGIVLRKQAGYSYVDETVEQMVTTALTSERYGDRRDSGVSREITDGCGETASPDPR